MLFFQMVFDLTNLLFKEEEIKMPESKTAEKRKFYHIVKSSNGWDLKEQNSSKVIETNPNKEELIRTSVERCNKELSELIIHDHNGVIEERRTYGNDPYPPTG